MELTEREAEVLTLIKQEPTISRAEIADQLGISSSAVGTYIHKLMNKGYLLGKGYIVAPEQKVVVVGGSNIDLKGYADEEYIPGTSNPGQLSETLGGVGRNIAENLAILEQPTVFLSAVGRDKYGEKLIEETSKPKLNLDYMLRSNNYRTGMYLAHIDPEGELAGAVVDMEILEAIDIDYLQQYRQVLETASVLVIDTNLTEPVVDYLLTLGYKKGITTVVESVSVSKSRKLKGKLDKIDILTPNLEEILEILTLEAADKGLKEKLELIEKTYRKWGLTTTLVISLGSQGAYLIDEEQAELITTSPVIEGQIIETTGAGDALTAGFIYGILTGNELTAAVDLGLKAAKITVQSKRSVNLSLQEKLNLT
jgi:pseudouridine kinase